MKTRGDYDTVSRYIAIPDAARMDIWRLKDQQAANFWVPGEVDMTLDKQQWDSVMDEKHPSLKEYIKHVLCFFANADGFVMDAIEDRMVREIDFMESKAFFRFQAAIEETHAETYAKFLIELIRDPSELSRLLASCETHPEVKRKTDLATNSMSAEVPIEELCMHFLCFEGIMFSSSFLGIFFLRDKGLMPGLTYANELISRDEGLHASHYALLIHKHLPRRPTTERAHEIVGMWTEEEVRFVEAVLPVDIPNLPLDDVCTYVRYTADVVLGLAGYPPLYCVGNPFNWMIKQGMSSKTNMHERKTSEYQKAGAMDDCCVFDLSAAF